MNKYENRLYDIREQSNLKQIEISNKLKVNRQAYSNWETGNRFIPLNRLNQFCNTYNVSMDYIYKIGNQKKANIYYNQIQKLDKIIIGNNLNYICKKNNLTQQELARRLNTTQSTISSYINGKTLLLTSFAIQICIEYNVSLD